MKVYDPVLMSVLFVVISIIFLIIMAKKYRWPRWSKIFERISFENS
jgi:hypothetical protein